MKKILFITFVILLNSAIFAHNFEYRVIKDNVGYYDEIEIYKKIGFTVIDIDKERNIVEVPVSSGSQIENKKVHDIPWPPHTLLVDVKRGSSQLIPDGNTVIRAGDFLYVLTETESAEEVQSLGSDLRK